MTMIELMVVVAIIGIISMFAFPSYQNSQRKARISEGIAKLVEVQSQIEKYRLNKRVPYKDIKFEEVVTVNTAKRLVVEYSSQKIYEISFAPATKKSSEKGKEDDDIYDSSVKYNLTATATGNWIKSGHPCSKLKMNGFGILSPTDCPK